MRISKLYIETVPQGGSGLRKKDNFWPHLPSSLTRRKPRGLEDEVDFVQSVFCVCLAILSTIEKQKRCPKRFPNFYFPN